VSTHNGRPVPPISVAHEHVVAALNTHLRAAKAWASGDRIRVLDIGCGDGLLLAYLQAMSDAGGFGAEVELHGFDVDEMGYQDARQRPRALGLLDTAHPGIEWHRRVKTIRSDAAWGYPAGFFDAAVSNQVLEHVRDLDHFLANLKNHLRPGGISVHLFPLKNYVVEGHTGIPFLHWLRSFDTQVPYVDLLSRMGVGRYATDRTMLGYRDTRSHARDTASFVQLYTSYRSLGDIARACNAHGLALSHLYTKDFYLAKLRRIARRRAHERYRAWRPFVLEALAFAVLKYVSSVTLTISRVEYDIGERIRREKEHHRRAERWVAMRP
jgi:SAM-dependent methyltransferase